MNIATNAKLALIRNRLLLLQIKNRLNKFFINFVNSSKELIKKIFRLLVLLIKLGVFSYIVAEIGLNSIIEAINNGNMFNLGIASVTPLAVTLSFSSLMYSRTRSINSKHNQFRSLYIAERLLSASGYYAIALLTALFCYLLSIKYHFIIIIKGTIAANYQSLIILVPLAFFFSFSLEIFYAIKAMKLQISGRNPTSVANKVKKLL